MIMGFRDALIYAVIATFQVVFGVTVVNPLWAGEPFTGRIAGGGAVVLFLLSAIIMLALWRRK